MSPNTTSRKFAPIFTSYLWPTVLAFFMAIFLSQWAVADPPEKVEAPATITAEDATPAPEADSTTLPAQEEVAGENTQIETTPAVNTVPMTKIELVDKCYEQSDGSFECVCEGEEECKVLATADHCEAGTHWGKDGYGGCTKVADNASE